MKKISKKTNSFDGIIFYTNPNYDIKPSYCENQIALTPPQQNLKIQLDKKQRGGKTITLITGFVGSQHDLETLSKSLKNKFGVGGSAKDGEIIIQGDFKEKAFLLLIALGYKIKKVGG
ncbi:MAG: translation initiation factor [Sphingobacteriales bacterium]|nr:MAG: translation initiation factor [Sphingobacteriales bacterium]TAF78198.1 MAG: translation initiation factor [Sphingobacteriales bacterium]